MNDTTVGQTVLAQLGGSQFAFMVGAKRFVASSDSLTFSFMRNGSGANRCTITLDASDTYTLRFWKLRGVELKTVKQFEGIYADSLRTLFSETTGLAVTVPQIHVSVA